MTQLLAQFSKSITDYTW